MPISARSKRTRLLLKAKLDQGINRGNTISPQESTRNSRNRQLIIHKNTSAPMLKSCVLKVPSLHTVQVPPLRLTSPEAIVRRHASVLEDSPHEPVLQVSPVKLTSPDSIPPQFIDAENSTTPILKGSSRKVHCLPTVRMPPLKLTSPLPILDQGRNGGPFFDSSFPPVVRVPFLPPSPEKSPSPPPPSSLPKRPPHRPSHRRLHPSPQKCPLPLPPPLFPTKASPSAASPLPRKRALSPPPTLPTSLQMLVHAMNAWRACMPCMPWIHGMRQHLRERGGGGGGGDTFAGKGGAVGRG